MLNRHLDGAYVCGPVNHPDLVVEPFVQEELVVLTSPCVEFEKLITKPDLKIVVLKAGCSYRLRLEAMLARRGIVGVRMLEFGTPEAIVSCVSAGIGMTLLPRAMFESVWERKRVRIHPVPNGDGWVGNRLYPPPRSAGVERAARLPGSGAAARAHDRCRGIDRSQSPRAMAAI